jgi:20S proteasome alpha/beta subunit
MTVIAWDGETLAADKRCVSNGVPSTMTKIFAISPGMMAGISGDAAYGMALVQWLMRGAKDSDFPKKPRNDTHAIVMVVTRGEQGCRIYENSPLSIRIEDKHHAIGSGRDFALAAMKLGYGAVRGVELAGELDINCGNGIDVLRFMSYGHTS